MIDGIGGAFVFSEDPTRLARWYEEAFGFSFEGSEEFGAYYQVFWGLDPGEVDRRMDTTFSIMKAQQTTIRPAPDEEPTSMYGDQSFMVNLRTRDLDKLIERLAERGVDIIKRDDESYGRFAWVRDIDGNRIELYEPIPPASSQKG